MNAAPKFNRLLLPVVITILSFAITSCDQNKKSNTTGETNDSSSVKKMGTDSNSNMPVYKQKDSTEKIPNPYDSTKK